MLARELTCYIGHVNVSMFACLPACLPQSQSSLPAPPACLPACPPACLPALPACPPACLPACLPAWHGMACAYLVQQSEYANTRRREDAKAWGGENVHEYRKSPRPCGSLLIIGNALTYHRPTKLRSEIYSLELIQTPCCYSRYPTSDVVGEINIELIPATAYTFANPAPIQSTEITAYQHAQNH
jgi:hypothetical protein